VHPCGNCPDPYFPKSRYFILACGDSAMIAQLAPTKKFPPFPTIFLPLRFYDVDRPPLLRRALQDQTPEFPRVSPVTFFRPLRIGFLSSLVLPLPEIYPLQSNPSLPAQLLSRKRSRARITMRTPWGIGHFDSSGRVLSLLLLHSTLWVSFPDHFSS